MLTKSFAVTWKQVGDGAGVADADLALINRYALEPLTPEQVYVRRMRLCNDQYDRGFERFPVAYLQRFVETIVGKALLPNHNSGGGGWFAAGAVAPTTLGRFFKAELEQEAGVTYLVPSFYMVRLASNEEARQQIDGGVWSHVSIGAFVDKRMCDLCGKDYDAYSWDGEGNYTGCPHVKGRVYNGQVCTVTYGGDLAKVEAVEGSIVWLGAQYGAEMSRAAGDRRVLGADVLSAERGRAVLSSASLYENSGADVLSAERPSGSTQHPEPSTALHPSTSAPSTLVRRSPWPDKEAMMQEKDKGEGQGGLPGLPAEQRVVLLQRDLGMREAELETSRAMRRAADDARAAQAEEIAALQRSLDAAVVFATDGKLYRADLAAEMKRLAGLVGAEKECAAILAAAGDSFDASRLKELVGEYQARFEKAFPPSGAGTPSPAKAAANDPRAPRAHNVI
jgi:hypothetical protein